MTADWTRIRCVECDDEGQAAEQPYCDHTSSYTEGRPMTRTLEATKRDLTDLPSLYSLLPLFSQPGSSGEERRASTDPSRPPTNLGVVDLLDTREKAGSSPVRDDYDLDKRAGARRQGILPTLTSWVRMVDGELHDEGRDHQSPVEAATVASECAFLALHLGWANDHQWFDELAADVKRMRDDCRRAVGEPEMPALVCTVPDCGWGVEELHNGSVFHCTGCGKITTRVEAQGMYERAQPKPLTECADAVGVSVRWLRKLIAAGELRHIGRGEGKTLLYAVQDASAAVASSRLRGQVPTG